MRARLLLIAALLGAAVPAHAQPNAKLTSPRVESRVRLRWDASLRRIVYAVDDDPQFRALGMAPPFLTDTSLLVTYPQLNPLRTGVTIAPKDAPVPAGAVLSRVRALLAFGHVYLPPPGVIQPPIVEIPGECAAARTAREESATITASLSATGLTVAGLVARWRQSIDDGYASGRGGVEAVNQAVMEMTAFLSNGEPQATQLDALLSRSESAAQVGPVQDTCNAAARAVYASLMLANPRGQFRQLQGIRSAIRELRDALAREFAIPVMPPGGVMQPAVMKWRGAEYILKSDITPSRFTSATLTVRLAQIDFDVDRSSGAMIALEEHAGSDTLEAQRFARLTYEFAVATVLSSVTTPEYGTTTDAAGRTVVARLSHAPAGISPAFLASFVCRCQTGPLVAPMFQVGIATSSNTPALLAGGGIRLFGLPKGDTALGVGGMFAWVKDLRTLGVGDPVGGTADIHADLKYTNRNGYYAALQYKF